MALYKVTNTTKSGHVFIALPGLQTIGPGQSKRVDLSESSRNFHEIVTLESQGHISVEAYDDSKAKADAAKADADAKAKAEADAKDKAAAEAKKKADEAAKK